MADGNIEDSTAGIIDDSVKIELTNEDEEDGSTSPMKGGNSVQSSPSHHMSQNQPLFPPMMSGPPPLLGKKDRFILRFGKLPKFLKSTQLPQIIFNYAY